MTDGAAHHRIVTVDMSVTSPLISRTLFAPIAQPATPAWVLAEDKAGMLSQAIGLAEAAALTPGVRLLRPRGR